MFRRPVSIVFVIYVIIGIVVAWTRGYITIGLVKGVLSALLAYPVAFHIARQRGRTQAYLLLVYVAPWLVNVAVKAFGWMLLLGPKGPVNRALEAVGLNEDELAEVRWRNAARIFPHNALPGIPTSGVAARRTDAQPRVTR